jgi:hypothetical protein
MPDTYEGWWRVAVPEVHFSVEDLASLSAEVLPDYHIKGLAARRYLQSLKMMVSPLPERMKN